MFVADFMYDWKLFQPGQKTFIDLDMSELIEPYPAAAASDAVCVTEYIEIVPLTSDTDDPRTTECDSGDWCAEVKQENLPVVKQEPEDVW